MELIGWSLNTIDQIFSTRRTGKGEPACPEGTFPGGYVMDPWGKWRVMCLSVLSIEDVEDAYIFGFMVIGMLLIGAGGYLIYRKLRKMMAMFQPLERLPVVMDGVLRAPNTQTQTLGEVKGLLCKMEDTLETLKARPGGMDHND